MAEQVGGVVSGAAGGVVGNVNTKFALKIRFTTGLSSQPRLEAWDNATDLAADTAPSDEILAGTASSGNNSWLAGVDTSATRPISGTVAKPWYPAAEDLGSSPSLLAGSVGYVTLDSVTVGVASRLFNLALKVPSDAAQSGTTQHTPVVAIRYYYTGTAPGLIWQYNTNTEASPTWVTMVAGTSGDTLHFTGPDSSAANNDPFTKPGTLTEVDEYWLATSGETF